MEETELKWCLSPDSAARISQSPLLSGAGEEQRMVTTYFDTPAHVLAKAGVSLRIRETNGRRIQTVKSGGGGAGLHRRSEWEKLVERDVPVLDCTTPVPEILGSDVSRLTRVFEIVTDRRVWTLREGDATIEVALDDGRVRLADRETQVRELELELKSGPPEALFALGRKLLGGSDARLGVLTKAERGYRLGGAACTSITADPVAVTDRMTATEAFREIVQACLRHFRLNEDLLFPARTPEALHQARVALRRLRSAFVIFKPMIGNEDPSDLKARLRDLAQAMGPARDFDVLLETVDQGELRDRITAAREAAYDNAARELASPTTQALMFDLVEWTALGRWQTAAETEKVREMPAAAFAAEALARFRRKVKKKGHDLASLDDEARHEVRKDAKKLRYAVEFFAPLFDRTKSVRKDQKAFLKALKALQDDLGALNDLAMAPALLARFGVKTQPTRKGKKRLIDNAAKAHGALADAPAYWKS